LRDFSFLELNNAIGHITKWGSLKEYFCIVQANADLQTLIDAGKLKKTSTG